MQLRNRASIVAVVPFLVLAYSFLMLPVEVRAGVGGFNIYSYRAAILVLVLLFSRRILSFFARMSIVDLLVLASCSWTLIAFTYRDGFEGGFIRAAAIFLDTFGAYLIARISIRSFADLRVALILLVPGLIFAGGMLALESLSGRLIVRPAFASLFGSAINYEGGVAQGTLQLLNERRLGLLRAYSTFSYPILGGTILASMLPLYYMSGLRGLPFILGLVACICSFFSVSSAAIICLVLAVGLIVADKVLPYLRPLNWFYVSSFAIVYGMILNFLLESGVVGVIGRFTLNPATAYIRRLQWDYGLESIGNHPIFGIGFREYERADWMTAAIDAHFLASGIRDGLLTPLLLIAAILVVMYSIGKASRFVRKQDRDMLVGVNFMLVTLMFAAFTVTYFSEANIWFMMALGLASSVMRVVVPRRAPVGAVRQDPRTARPMARPTRPQSRPLPR